MPLCLLLAALVAVGDARNPLPPRVDSLIVAGHPDYAKHAAPLADDAEFVRRLHLDLTGTIPTAAEVRAFLADKNPNKRAIFVNSLLESPGYVRRMVWFLDVTLMERRGDAKVPRAAWETYLQAAVAENRPYNALVRDLLSNDGSDPKTRPAAKFLLDRDLEPNLVTRDLARIFLGRNLQCAQCHDHPSVDDYKQEEYYGIQAFVNRSFLFPNAQAATAIIAEKAEGDVTFMSVFDKAKKSYTITPKMPGAKPVAEEKPEKGKEYKVAPAANVRPVPTYSRRERLANAMTSRDNPAFARTAVNRIWAMMLGRGLVHSLDFDHSANPPSHPELLELLATEFVDHNYDVKWLVRQIALTQTYQRSSIVPATLADVPADRYLVASLKPLTPEQLAFAISQACGQPDGRGALGPFRGIFGNRPGESQDGPAATLDQTLFLKYGASVRGQLGTRANLLAKLPSDDAIAEELFLGVLSRMPTDDEKHDVADALKAAKDRTATLSELTWALIASAEFRFNH
ncbi:MAG: hypothetical protein C0467_24925 [Planctomycetaceae bacterium]|nr:hypothetical protein [Planctomycetaceae bacterium]